MDCYHCEQRKKGLRSLRSLRPLIKHEDQLPPAVQLTGHNSQKTETKINMGPNIEPGHPSRPHPSASHPSGPHPSAPHPGGIYSGQSPPPSYATALQASGYTDLTGHNIQETEGKINMGPNMEPGHLSEPHSSTLYSSGPYPSVPHPCATRPGGIYSGQTPPPSYATALHLDQF